MDDASSRVFNDAAKNAPDVSHSMAICHIGMCRVNNKCWPGLLNNMMHWRVPYNIFCEPASESLPRVKADSYPNACDEACYASESSLSRTWTVTGVSSYFMTSGQVCKTKPDDSPCSTMVCMERNESAA